MGVVNVGSMDTVGIEYMEYSVNGGTTHRISSGGYNEITMYSGDNIVVYVKPRSGYIFDYWEVVPFGGSTSIRLDTNPTMPFTYTATNVNFTAYVKRSSPQSGVNIYYNGSWRLANSYVRNTSGTDWQQATEYVYYNGWKEASQ